MIATSLARTRQAPSQCAGQIIVPGRECGEAGGQVGARAERAACSGHHDAANVLVCRQDGEGVLEPFAQRIVPGIASLGRFRVTVAVESVTDILTKSVSTSNVMGHT